MKFVINCCPYLLQIFVFIVVFIRAYRLKIIDAGIWRTMQVNLEQKPKTYVVINPVAGVSQLEVVRERVQSALRERDVPFEIYETTGKENIMEMVREKVNQGFKLFISAGGDGTLSSVIDGLVETQIPLVIIPTGTWNALARALDIPLQID